MSKISINQRAENIRKELQIEAPSEYHTTKYLNRFRIRYPDLEQERSVGYIFFTKPDLNILTTGGDITQESANIHSLRDILQSRDIEIARCLKHGYKSRLITPITNAAENVDLQDVQMKTRTTAESSINWKVQYGFRTSDSKAANTFNITFTDDKNLTLYKLHKIWVEYIDAVSVGKMKPLREYITKRVLDYAVSAYYILVGEDGKTIRYYAKFTGVFPLNIPDSAYGWQQGDEIKRRNFQIQYQYSFFDAMEPLIIKDFNVSFGNPAGSPYQPIFIKDMGLAGPTYCSGVVINKVQKGGPTGKLEYKLEFIQ